MLWPFERANANLLRYNMQFKVNYEFPVLCSASTLDLTLPYLRTSKEGSANW